MPVSTRSKTRQAKAALDAQAPTNLNNMPVEIINVIVDHLHASSIDQPKIIKKYQPCRCIAPEGHQSRKEKKALAYSSNDASLALSCVSRRMRNVVFDNQTNRSISTSYCVWGMKQAQAASEVLRRNVR